MVTAWNILMGIWCYHSLYRFVKRGSWETHKDMCVLMGFSGTLIIAGALLLHYKVM